MLGLSRNASYEAAKRGDIPTIRIGKLIRVPKLALHRMLEGAGTMESGHDHEM
jgi:excisionase family DNA binding protein